MKAWIRDLYIKSSKRQNTNKLCVHWGEVTKKYRTAGRGINLVTGYDIQDFIEKLNKGFKIKG